MTTKTTTDLLDTIVARNYAATDAEVTALAGGAAAGVAAAGTYLKVLVAAVQGRLGPIRRRRIGAVRVDAMGALEAEHARLYALVLAGVGPSDLDMRERNRRATFARTAASTIRAFIKGNGDVTSITPADVTKTQLRKAIAAPEADNKVLRGATRARDALLRAVSRYITKDPDEAAGFIEQCIQSLEEHLQEEVDPGGETTVIGVHPRIAPAPTVLHRGATPP